MTRESDRLKAKKSIFHNLSLIDVSKKTQTRKNGFNNLSYISWADAIAEVSKKYPKEFSYEILESEEGKPFFYDDVVGYWVKTKVKIQDQEKKMMLPVLDGANKVLKKEPYTYEVKNKQNPSQPIKKNVEAIDIQAINKAIMRCLVKNLALFGFGLSLYAKDDIYSNEERQEINAIYITSMQKEALQKLIEETDSDVEVLCANFQIDTLDKLPITKFKTMETALNNKKQTQENISIKNENT